MGFPELAQRVASCLRDVPKFWDGKAAITEMRDGESRQWRQMEWTGFYFQFLCEKHLSSIVTMPGPQYGNVHFDGFLEIPWDFKAHAINTSSHEVIVNDSRAIADAIAQYGSVGLIMALGQVEYNDEMRSFQQWHSQQKGEMSAYEKERIRRGAWSRLRKVSFDLRQISLVRITDETLVKTGSFQQDFRNADGSPRNAKVLLDLERLDEEIVFFLDF